MNLIATIALIGISSVTAGSAITAITIAVFAVAAAKKLTGAVTKVVADVLSQKNSDHEKEENEKSRDVWTKVEVRAQ